jgi:hypothetical protein
MTKMNGIKVNRIHAFLIYNELEVVDLILCEEIEIRNLPLQFIAEILSCLHKLKLLKCM